MRAQLVRSLLLSCLIEAAFLIHTVYLTGGAIGADRQHAKPSPSRSSGETVAIPAACCEGQTSNVAAPAVTVVKRPQMSVDALRQLRLPDVRLISVEHHDSDPDDHIRQEERTFAGISGSGGITVPHVQVDGVIGGTVHFEILLPQEWNRRFVMGGGGGYVGRVINWGRFTANHGFVTVGTDTGHQSDSVMTAKWALNDVEAQLNFGYLAVHRTVEVAKAITRAYYGDDPEYSYFIGCSRGGGQALMEAQRYPDDFDGIVAAAPALDWPGFTAAALYSTQQLYPDPANLSEPILSREDLNQLHAEVLKQCDAIDGVEDGILDDPRECEFDLSKVEGFTAAQRETIRAIYEGPSNERGHIYPGIPLGAEGYPAGWYYWITGPLPPALIEGQRFPSVAYALGTEFYRYFVFRDPAWDYTSYDFTTWKPDTELLATFLNATNPDLNAFKQNGGKLILWHGWGDSILTAHATIKYYEEIVRRDPQHSEYVKLYLMPGVMHCLGGPGPDSVDWLSTIVDWVEHDKAPARLIASKFGNESNVSMSRPLYPYPQRAAYTGSGSTNDAANFILAESPQPSRSRLPVPDKLVVLTFDDSVKSHATVAAPLLKKYGFGATFFITEGFTFLTNKTDYMTWDEIEQLHDDGFEIGNHTKNHMALTEQSFPRLRAELEHINRKCQEHGIPRTTSYAYCGNFVWDDPRVYELLHELGIVWARRGTRPEYSGPGFERIGFPFIPGGDHPLLLPSAGIPAPEFTMEDFIEAVAMARDGNIAILQFHGVPEGEHPWVHVEQSLFEAFMKYLKDNDFQVIALRDLARYVDPHAIPADHTAIIKQRRSKLATQPSLPR